MLTEEPKDAAGATDYSYKTTVKEIIGHYTGPGIGLKKLNGFYRELIDIESTKCYGTQELTDDEVKANAERYVGFYGGQERTFTQPFEVQRGHKIVTVKASVKNPVRCREHIYPHV